MAVFHFSLFFYYIIYISWRNDNERVKTSYMGQYYTAILFDEQNQPSTCSPYDFDNGSKLMEHSYIANNFVNAVLAEIQDAPHRVYWLGDYAEDKHFRNQEFVLTSKRFGELTKNESIRIQPTPANQTWIYDGFYAINLDKREYVKFENNNPHEYQINPLPLLTAVGNGEGGGDYAGVNEDVVGIWAGNYIYITKQLPIDKEFEEEFQDKTKEYLFGFDLC